MNLKPCPCGKTPAALCVTGEEGRAKWALVSGDCCGEWMIEFRNNYRELSDPDMESATAAWNAASRKDSK